MTEWPALSRVLQQRRRDRERAAEQLAGTSTRERVLAAVRAAGAEGLTMGQVLNAVDGSDGRRAVEATVRELWATNVLVRRPDGTYVTREQAA